MIRRDGLKAFVYGAVSDSIANPAENAPFAAQLRAAGASAHGAVYAGEHDMQTLHAHLPHMLLFAGSALAQDIGTRRVGAGHARAMIRSGCGTPARRGARRRGLGGATRSARWPPAQSPAEPSRSARWRSAGWRFAAPRSAR